MSDDYEPRLEKTISLPSTLCGYDLWRLDRFALFYGSRKYAVRHIVGKFFESMSDKDIDDYGISFEEWTASPEYANYRDERESRRAEKERLKARHGLRIVK